MPLTCEEFEAQYKALYPSIHTFFRNRGFDEDQAQQFAQDAFVEAFEKRHTYRGEGSPRSWIFAIARNLWRNHWRDQDRLKRTGDEVPYHDWEQDERRPGQAPGNPAPSDPLDDALRAETDAAVRAAIETLPREQQEALVLRMDQELQYSEIAALLRISVDLVKSRLYQARQNLKSILSPLFDANGY